MPEPDRILHIPLGTYRKHSNNLILRDPFLYTNMCPSLHVTVRPCSTSRSYQRAIYRLILFVRPYNQIIHTDQTVCPYCDEHYDIYTVYYICVCPASQVHRSKLLVDVPSHMYNIDYTPLTLESLKIIRRQGARRHKELIQLINRFPPASN